METGENAAAASGMFLGATGLAEGAASFACRTEAISTGSAVPADTDSVEGPTSRQTAEDTKVKATGSLPKMDSEGQEHQPQSWQEPVLVTQRQPNRAYKSPLCLQIQMVLIARQLAVT